MSQHYLPPFKVKVHSDNGFYNSLFIDVIFVIFSSNSPLFWEQAGYKKQNMWKIVVDSYFRRGICFVLRFFSTYFRRCLKWIFLKLGGGVHAVCMRQGWGTPTPLCMFLAASLIKPFQSSCLEVFKTTLTSIKPIILSQMVAVWSCDISKTLLLK